MWKSPIEIQQDIVRQVDMVIEDGVMKAIQRFDINVDKEELIKALKYDRDQYEKGYQDGLNANKWIPCSERLPDIKDGKYTSDCVLVTLKWWDGEISETVGWYSRTGTWSEGGTMSKVIAWMPYEPYKGE